MQQLSPRTLAALVAVVSPVYAQDFEPERVSIDRYGSLSTVDIADIDGDGDQDIALGGGGAVLWIENLGDGVYRRQLSVLDGEAQLTAGRIRLTDIDLDGDADLVHDFGFLPGLALIQSLGGGSFAPPIVIDPSYPSTAQFVLADLDGDGLEDIIAYDRSPDLFWYRSLGSGSFAPRADFNTQQGDVTGMAVADMDGDSDLDIVLSKRSGDRILWIEQLSPGLFDVTRLLTQAIERPEQLRVVDLDGDGDLDLAARNGSSLGIETVEHLGGLTFGSAMVAAPLVLASGSFQLRDLNADGLPDLFWFPLSLSLEFRENLGGTFAPTESFTTGLRTPRDVAFFDREGDGDVDILVADFDRLSFLDRTPTGFGSTTSLVINVDDFSPYPTSAVSDLNGDGLADLVAAEFDPARRVYVLPNVGDGIWADESSRFNIGLPDLLKIVDIDGDGDDDLIVASRPSTVHTLEVALNDGEGLLDTPTTIQSVIGTDRNQFEVGDADADGDLDILWTRGAPFGSTSDTVHGWLIQTAPGTFGGELNLPADSLSDLATVLLDSDGDGDSDVVFLRPFQRQPRWRANDGTGVFGPAQTIGSPAAQFLVDVEGGDFDGDGLDDVAAVRGGAVEWYRSLGGGAFDGPFLIDASAGGTSLLARDVNQDGLVDLFVNRDDAPARLIRSLGGGAFEAPQLLDEIAPGSRVFDVADYDGDLDLDVFKRLPYGGYAWNTNTERFGNGFCGPAEINSSGDWAAMSASGSALVSDNDVTLIAERLPAGSFGYFLIAPGESFVPAAGGSSGNLCLGGAIGRLNRGSAEIFQGTADGTAAVSLDLTNVPTPTGAVALLPGDTRYVQAWFRDANPGVTSNFTSGLRLMFE